jgi:hypothetical protein
MDINLTHAIAANVTLAQAQTSSLDPTLVAFLSGVVVALIVALIGSGINYKIAQKNIEASAKNNKDALEASIKNSKDTLEGTNRTIESTLENTRATIEHDKFKMVEEERREKNNKMQQTYSELMGRKYMILQYNASYFSEIIRSGFLINNSLIFATSNVDYPQIAEMAKTDLKKAEREMGKIINDMNEASMEYKIAREADNRSRELQLKLGEGYERFWVTIGLVQILFPESELKTIVDPIIAFDKDKIFEKLETDIVERDLKFKSYVMKKATDAVSGKPINFKEMQEDAFKLNETMISELKSRLDEFESRIDDLLKYLETVIVAKE